MTEVIAWSGILLSLGIPASASDSAQTRHPIAKAEKSKSARNLF